MSGSAKARRRASHGFLLIMSSQSTSADTALPSVEVVIKGDPDPKESQRPLVNACRALAVGPFQEQRCAVIGS